MSHDHGSGAARAGERHKRRLVLALAITAVVFVVEVVAGVLTNSLALISDAGHMLTDVVGLAMALAAIQLASRAGTGGHRTYGLYRLEILAALANTVLLFGVGFYVLYEAAVRLRDPEAVRSGAMLVVAAVGLVANVVSFLLLREGSEESLNVKGAYLEVLADLVGSVGVLVAAGVIAATGWEVVDPVIGAAIGLFILPRAYRLGAQAVRILVQAAPPHLDLDRIGADLAALPDVVDVHDLHVWTLTSDMEVASAHVMIRRGADPHAALDRARQVLAEGYGVDHATLQIEPDDHEGCQDLGW
jgi:cobalt-zinc-cadmium efflux system protein